jgi:hypothetical protein
MIDIFDLKNEKKFFLELSEMKMKEEKYREVVHIISIFPEIMSKMTPAEADGDIRYELMDKLIQQNDITSARLLMAKEAEAN